jgi:hypothetical protein
MAGWLLEKVTLAQDGSRPSATLNHPTLKLSASRSFFRWHIHRSAQPSEDSTSHQRSITAGPLAKPSVMWLHSIERVVSRRQCACQNSHSSVTLGNTQQINACSYLLFLVMGKWNFDVMESLIHSSLKTLLALVACSSLGASSRQ